MHELCAYVSVNDRPASHNAHFFSRTARSSSPNDEGAADTTAVNGTKADNNIVNSDLQNETVRWPAWASVVLHLLINHITLLHKCFVVSFGHPVSKTAILIVPSFRSMNGWKCARID